jgi:hypothetical protein
MQPLNPWGFNPAQLATWDQARDLAQHIDAFRQKTGALMGGGVAKETTNVDTSGIYVPDWQGGPEGFPVPNDTSVGKYWLHFRFNNGASGVNVGLILDKIARFGGNEAYVFMAIANDLQVR